MTIAAPVILLPTGGANYTTDVVTQTLSGTTAPETKQILVNGSTFGVSFTPGETAWAWSGNLILGTNTYNITALDAALNPSLPTTIVITLVQSNTFVTVTAPTGVRVREYQDKMEILNAKNPEAQTIGYNYYVSTQSGGVNGAYVRINTQLIDNKLPSFSETNTKVLNEVTDTAGNIRVTTTTEEIDTIDYYSAFFDKTMFSDMVIAGLLPGVTWSEDTPFFFVCTAVIYDSIMGQVTESTHSAELQGAPLIITTGLRTIPTRSQSDIILTISQELLTADSGIDVKPGTVQRDQIDPITEEMARLYVIQDFMSRSLSVSSLQDFDDANADGISDPVTSSVPKTALQVALNITDPNDVQALIDAQFDKLASNVNVIRRGATQAVGTVVFYIQTAPIRDMTVNQGAIVTSPGNLDQGIPSENYQVLVSKTLSFATASQFYNSQTQRYELSCDVQAVSAGSQGNTDSYTINTVTSGADSDFQVENPNPIEFGQDTETNDALAGRLELALFADTGTAGGYARTTLAVQGVQDVKVVKAMDALMIRDYDPVRQTHVGGKVDIYVQGRLEKQVTDQIAFSYQSIAETQGGQVGENFLVLNAVSFQFQSTNANVTAHTPIFDVSRVHNSTRNADYDIAGYQIIGQGNIIDLDETKPTNVLIGLASTDIVQVDYKYRSSDTFVLGNQPVDSIVSVVGQLSGTLTPDNWDLVKLQDPLDKGGSNESSDSLRIKFANNLPVTGFQTITNEPHTLILEKPEPLNFIGADPTSVLITNNTSTTTYSVNIDYRITPGTSSTALTVIIIDTGAISSGQPVLISYTAIENFTITYSTNGLLDTVQTQIDSMKHACADAVVKNAIENRIDFAFTAVAKSTVTSTANLIAQMQTAVANHIAQLDIGASVTQSEIVSILQSIPDVNYIILPMTRMVKSDGDFIVRDPVGQTQFELFNEGLSVSYISTDSVLTYNTIDQGGDPNLFRGIFENNQPLVLQTDPLAVSDAAGRGYIRADGKIIVSTIDGQLPDTKSYEVSYYVFGETGAKDINTASIEYLSVGSFTPNIDVPKS